jgi:CIC family chloride channel protein
MSFNAADIVQPAPESLPVHASLATATAALSANALGIAPVLGPEGRYLGCLTAQAVAEALDDPDPPAEITDLVQRPTVLAADTPPQQILSALTGHGGTGLPVINAQGTALIGWITYETLLARMHPEFVTGPGRGVGFPTSTRLRGRR